MKPNSRKEVVAPSERPTRAERVEERLKKATKMRQHVVKVAKTDSGIELLRQLMKVCGYQESSLVVSPVDQEVSVQATLYNEAIRSVWLEMRKLIPPDRLALIENPQPDLEEEKHE